MLSGRASKDRVGAAYVQPRVGPALEGGAGVPRGAAVIGTCGHAGEGNAAAAAGPGDPS